ncbi:hypothetical protein D9M68_700640 [compost metagenome]
MRNSGSQLSERGKLFRLDQSVLRRLEFFEGVRQFLGSCPHFLKKAHILDGNHGLVGKGRCQLDLLVREWPHGGTGQCEHPDRASLAQERHAKYGTKPAKSLRFRHGVLGIVEDVGHLNRPDLKQGSPDYAPAPRLQRERSEILVEFLREAVAGDWIMRVTDRPGHRRHVRLAKTGSGRHQSIQNRLQVERGAADDLQDVSRRGLLF